MRRAKGNSDRVAQAVLPNGTRVVVRDDALGVRAELHGRTGTISDSWPAFGDGEQYYRVKLDKAKGGTRKTVALAAHDIRRV